MLPAGNRLRRRQDFATAVRRGQRVGRPLLVAHLYSKPAYPTPVSPQRGTTPVSAESPPLDDPHAVETVENYVTAPRVGFVVSRAVGGATVRNTVKRRLRHLVRGRLTRLPPGSLVVVRALPPAAEASSAELAADLDAALWRLLRSYPERRRR